MQFAAEVKTFTCISCPCGCLLEVSFNDHGDIEEISGYTCAKGKVYAQAEATHPQRMVTAVVCAQGCLEPLSVKTARPVPKQAIGVVLAQIAQLQLVAPIAAGDIVCSDIAGTGVDLVATKDIRATD